MKLGNKNWDKKMRKHLGQEASIFVGFDSVENNEKGFEESIPCLSHWFEHV